MNTALYALNTFHDTGLPPLGLPRTCHAYGLNFLTAYLAANTEIVDVVPTTCLGVDATLVCGDSKTGMYARGVIGYDMVLLGDQ
jgi:hypothetical protein